jgi:hypothetical protein
MGILPMKCVSRASRPCPRSGRRRSIAPLRARRSMGDRDEVEKPMIHRNMGKISRRWLRILSGFVPRS